jgi:uncharacterized protein (TIGR02453 family)
MTANIPAFTGFPASGIEFLRELSENNNKLWFDANKARFINDVQTPALSLIVSIGEKLQAHFPTIHYDTRTNGGGSLMRQYRDVRFSADKSPYKTNVAMMFVPSGRKKMESAGFGLQITPDQVDVMAGQFSFSKEELATYREAVLTDKLGKALETAVAQVQQAGAYTIEGATYKRIPSGYDVNHPRAEWLKFTGLHVFAPTLSLEVAQTPALADIIVTHFVSMAPVYHWINEYVSGV